MSMICKWVGEQFKTNSHGTATIIEYRSYDDVTIKFDNTGSVRCCGIDTLKTGFVKDRGAKNVVGVGINKVERPARVKGKPVKEYRIWRNMLDRCYSNKQAELYPTYVGCRVSEDFLNYTTFYDWCQTQQGFHKGYELDKDVLSKGIKIYSPNTCRFVPKEINNLVNKLRNNKGYYWSNQSNKFVTEVFVDGKKKFLGRFSTEQEARNAVVPLIKQRDRKVLDSWKGEIPIECYLAIKTEIENLT